jgi:hypothetical protein
MGKGRQSLKLISHENITFKKYTVRDKSSYLNLNDAPCKTGNLQTLSDQLLCYGGAYTGTGACHHCNLVGPALHSGTAARSELPVTAWSRKLIENKCSLPRSQQPATGSCPEPAKTLCKIVFVTQRTGVEKAQHFGNWFHFRLQVTGRG